MPGDICPIFERKDGDEITLVGAWMQHPVNLRIVPDSANFLELGHIGPMVASYFKNEPYRQISNDETDVGRGCKFVGGAFMMGHDHPSPNEAGGQPEIEFEYLMKDNDGVTVCVRERRAGRERSSQGEQRKWWQFWK